MLARQGAKGAISAGGRRQMLPPYRRADYH